MLKALLALCAVAGLCTMLAAPSARATPATEIFIQLNVDKGYMILNSMSLSDTERREQFRTLLLGLFASRRIALFTLGPYATGAAPADVDAFVDAFTDYSVAVYENRLDRYKGETLKVTGSSDRAADDSVVQTEFVSPNPSNGPPIRIAFRVRRGENGEPAVTDMQIEGVSLAMTQHDDFTAYLQQHNGSIPELAKHLGALSDKIALKADKVSADPAAEHGAGK